MAIGVKDILIELMCFFYIIIKKISNLFYVENDDILYLSYDRVGDFFVKLGSIENLRKEYKKKRIVFVSTNTEINDIARNTYFDDVVLISNNSTKGLLDLMKYTFHKKYQIYINSVPCHIKRFKVFYRFNQIVSATKKVYIDRDYNNNALNVLHINYINKNQNSVIVLDEHYYNVHYYQNKLINIISDSNYSVSVGDLSFLISKDLFNHDFINNDIIKSKRYFIVNLASSDDIRRYPVSKFSNIIKFFIEKYDVYCILTGVKNETIYYNELKKYYDSDKIVSLIGKTKIIDLIYIVSRAMFVLTNDTGIAHIAPVVNTKAFVISPSNHLNLFYPYIQDAQNYVLPLAFTKIIECSNCAINKPFDRCSNITENNVIKCMDLIDENDIIDSINDYLKK